MARVVVAAVLASWGVWLGGCAGSTVGGEDGDQGTAAGGKTGSPAKPLMSPAKQCENYVSTWCRRSFGCYVDVGRLDQGALERNVDMCKKLLIEKLPCSAVQSVGSSYAACVSQVETMSCSQWDVPQEKFATVPAPASCDSALAF